METRPNLIEEDLSPAWFQSRRPTLFKLQGHQLLFDVLRALATLQEVGMNILAGRVGRECLG